MLILIRKPESSIRQRSRRWTGPKILSLLLLAVGVHAGSLVATWQASPDRVAGYRLYWGGEPRNYTNSVDAGRKLTVMVSGLDVTNGNYYFGAVAYTTNGDESAYSNEAHWKPGDYANYLTNPPPAALGLSPVVPSLLIHGEAHLILGSTNLAGTNWVPVGTAVVTGLLPLQGLSANMFFKTVKPTNRETLKIQVVK